MVNNRRALLELSRSQILQGRDNKGQLFQPGYSNDPYFKSRESAARYAAFKASIVSTADARVLYPLFTQKPTDVPNLFITGVFNDGLFIKVNGINFTVGSFYKDADAINKKYNGNVFGLSPEAVQYFRINVYLPEIRKTLFK